MVLVVGAGATTSARAVTAVLPVLVGVLTPRTVPTVPVGGRRPPATTATIPIFYGSDCHFKRARPYSSEEF